MKKQVWMDDNGSFHREDGPAFIAAGFASWWKHGLRHRLDGPAVIDNGKEQFWFLGNKLTLEEYHQLLCDLYGNKYLASSRSQS